MRLPFVSREQYEADLHYARFERDTARASDDFTRRLFADLLEKFTALKLAGATLPPPVAQYTPKEADPYDELKALIAEQAGTDLRRRGMMLRQLQKDRADGVPPDEIRRSIETGIVPDGVPV